ncbi:dihydropteroate synthase [Thalassiella azotivora]
MGVVNVTPDSFSDGGRWFDEDAAVAHGLELVAQGADVVDVGGESTRPGAPRVQPEEELRRVVPVVSALAAQGVAVSVDTTRALVAEAALDAGARLVNDVSGGLADERMAAFVASSGAAYVVMHWRGHSVTMDDLAVYDDVVAEVRDELAVRVEHLVAAGASPEQLVLDPGLGFSKTGEHNWQVLHRLGELDALGLPLLVGTSRKRFLGSLLAGADGEPVPPTERDAATAATSALAAAAGVWGVRVHEVPSTVDAVKVGTAWRRGGTS